MCVEEDQVYDDAVTTLSQAEWCEAAERALERVGLTYAELAAQAETDNFTSTAAQKLWYLIGGTLP